VKKLLLISASCVALASGSAIAADMPVKAPVYKAPPVPTYNWTGFYLGGYFGESIGNQQGSTDPQAPGGHQGVTNVNRLSGTFGGTFGFNWQFAPQWLVGLEGDIGTLGISRTNLEFNDDTEVGLKANWYGTARARFGYVTGPSVLYVTGGAAFVHEQVQWGGTASPFVPFTPPATASATKASGTVGGGIETKLSQNWSTKTEYLFIGRSSIDLLGTPRGAMGVPSAFHQDYHVIRTGLNYEFGGANEGMFAFITAPPLPSNHDWSGFYAGVNAGGGMSLTTAKQNGIFPGTTEVNGTGLAGGAHVGYNLTNVVSPKWFVGVEGDLGALKIKASMNDWFDEEAQFTEKTSWYGTARVRVGTNTGPALLYLTGGGAWVHFTDGFAPFMLTPGTGTLTSTTRAGWTFGGGTEVALDSHWSARLESLLIDAGSTVHNILQNSPPGSFGADFRERFMVVRAGVTYQFGVGNLVASRN
jgi:outer membrane immunogenic protein